MRQVRLNYKSGNTVKVNYTDNVDITYKGGQLTKIDIDGAIMTHDHPLFWGFENVESVVVVSVGWQRAAEWLASLAVRFAGLFRRNK